MNNKQLRQGFMREFKKYAPRQVAKYVCDFFKGYFRIAGLGVFQFDRGIVLMPKSANAAMQTVCREVNTIINNMRLQMRAAPAAPS